MIVSFFYGKFHKFVRLFVHNMHYASIENISKSYGIRTLFKNISFYVVVPQKVYKVSAILMLSTYCAQNICRIFAKKQKSLQIYRCLPPKNTCLS